MSYTVQDIVKLYKIHKNTVSHWIKSGLKINDHHKPYLIHGSELKRFLDEKQKKRKVKCATNELYCFKCKKPRFPAAGSVKIEIQNKHRLKVQGQCFICQTRMFKAASLKHHAELTKTFTTAQPHTEHIIDCSDTSLNSD